MRADVAAPHQVDMNLTGAILCARRAVRDMRAGGVIVNVSSAAATLGSAHTCVHYAAAKAGVDTLTLGLPAEIAEAIVWLLGDSCPDATGTTLRVAGGR